jgi:glyoxylase-like metal-dependent hydrolase (beta-lactamase superfamily II)
MPLPITIIDNAPPTRWFPNATVVDFWATYKNDLWEDHPDKYSIDSGIEVWKTPGHTDEDASLVVRTAKGTVVFTHEWWFQAPDGSLFPPKDPIGEDAGALEASRGTVVEIADCIVPGHGAPFPNPKKPDAVCALGK